PEAPVPVVRFQSEHVRLGGAANVAHNIAALGGRVSLIGVVGCDASADRLRAELMRAGIGIEGLIGDRSRPTVEKMRIVTERNQQVAGVDYEQDQEVSEDVEAALKTRIDEAAAATHVLLVSDYLKGAVTRGVMTQLARLRRPRGVPLIVDPKIP